MTLTKTPTSSLSVVELLVKRVWYGSRARIRKSSSADAPPENPTTRPSLATRLPQDVIEIIFTHLYDKYSLCACSLTCYSWYIAAVPHLHHTFVIRNSFLSGKFRWPIPLRRMHRLGLLPLVRKFHIIESPSCRNGFHPRQLNYSVWRQFSALTNVQELGIDRLNIPEFMPRIGECFKHFLPTLRSLALGDPEGSHRQIIYFIGLFQNLEDLKILYRWDDSQKELADDPTLVPLFAPPLRGRLTMRCSSRVGLLKEMIKLFGGIQFRYMDLFDVCEMRLLLNACATTLEALRLYPTDPRGEQLPLKGTKALANDFAARSSPQDFDLSRSMSLRALEVTADSIDGALKIGSRDVVSSFFKHILSTTTCSVPFEVIVFYRNHDFYGVQSMLRINITPLARIAEEASRHHQRFAMLREVHKVQDFQLVLCANVCDRLGKYSVRELENAVAAEKASGGFDNIFTGLLVDETISFSFRKTTI